MLLHKLLQQLVLFGLITRRLALPLHLLVVHHLLDHPSCLAVEFRQLAVFRLNLGRVDLWRRGDDVSPPVRASGLGEVDRDFFAGRCRLERPGRLVDVNGMCKLALLKKPLALATKYTPVCLIHGLNSS
jgi:hypothetical protein